MRSGCQKALDGISGDVVDFDCSVMGWNDLMRTVGLVKSVYWDGSWQIKVMPDHAQANHFPGPWFEAGTEGIWRKQKLKRKHMKENILTIYIYMLKYISTKVFKTNSKRPNDHQQKTTTTTTTTTNNKNITSSSNNNKFWLLFRHPFGVPAQSFPKKVALVIVPAAFGTQGTWSQICFGK